MRYYILVLSLFMVYAGFGQTNNEHKSYLEAGFSGGTNAIGGAAGVYGATGFYFPLFGKASAIDLRAKELYVSSPRRTAGSITVTYRLFLSRGFYLGAGFAHNHEIAFDDFVNEPIEATMGTSKYIIHRSGFCAEAGYDFPSLVKNKKFGIYPTINLNAAYMARDREPNPLITLSAGFRFGFKRI